MASDYLEKRMREAQRAELLRQGLAEEEADEAMLPAASTRSSDGNRIAATAIGLTFLGVGLGISGYYPGSGGAGYYVMAYGPIAVGGLFLNGALMGIPLWEIFNAAFPRRRSNMIVDTVDPPFRGTRLKKKETS